MSVELDRDLAASLRYAREQLDFWNEEVEKLKALAIAAAGDDEELTVDGKLVFTNARVNKFRTADFRKQYPEVAQYFTKVERRDVEFLDLEALKQGRPDLHAQFLSRSFRAV